MKYLIVNGTRNLIKYLPSKFMYIDNTIIIVDTDEKTLKSYKDKFPTKSYYLYDTNDLKGKTIHDIGPTISLYDEFVKIHITDDGKIIFDKD